MHKVLGLVVYHRRWQLFLDRQPPRLRVWQLLDERAKVDLRQSVVVGNCERPPVVASESQRCYHRLVAR